MLSWRLFRVLNVFNLHPIRRHPVYRRERRHLRAHSPLLTGGLSWLVVLLSVGVLAFGAWGTRGFDPALICVLPLCWFAPLLVILPAVPVWILPLSMGLAPAVALNRGRGRWTLVCVTPQDRDEVLMALARAALERLRSLLVWMLAALLLPSWLIGTAFAEALLRYNAQHDVLGTQDRVTLAAVGVLLWAFGALVMYADRLQQVIVMGTGAFLGGALAGRSVRAAVLYGALAAWGLWTIEIGIGGGVVLLLPGSPQDKALAVVITLVAGPVPGYMVALPLAWALLAVALTLLLREAILRGLWALLRHYACAA